MEEDNVAQKSTTIKGLFITLAVTIIMIFYGILLFLIIPDAQEKYFNLDKSEYLFFKNGVGIYAAISIFALLFLIAILAALIMKKLPKSKITVILIAIPIILVFLGLYETFSSYTYLKNEGIYTRSMFYEEIRFVQWRDVNKIVISFETSEESSQRYIDYRIKYGFLKSFLISENVRSGTVNILKLNQIIRNNEIKVIFKKEAYRKEYTNIQ